MTQSYGIRVDASTEARNRATVDIDVVPTIALLRMINDEDARVPAAVGQALTGLAQLVDVAVSRVVAGGRVHYCGAGTSGRIAVLDAAEVPPTYGLPADLIVAHLAGGAAAIDRAVEGIEDDEDQGSHDVSDVRSGDVVIGLAASGRTPYVRGALLAARQVGAFTALVSANAHAPLADLADVHVLVDTGPEAITGSTRMKAASAEKLVLTSFSTALAVRLGRTYSNLMVDLTATNEKLRGRSIGILEHATGSSEADCVRALHDAGGELKPALVSLLANCTAAEARQRLHSAGGRVRDAL